MRSRLRAPIKIALVTLAFFLGTGLLGALIHQAFAQSVPGVDLYVFWSAARALQAGQTPYSPELTAAIQMGIYGHLLGPGQDPMHFAYPPYCLLPIWPLAWLSFDWAEALWLSFNLLVVAAGLRLARPHAPGWSLPLVLFVYPFSFGLILGNFAVLISVIILYSLVRLWLDKPDPAPWEQVFLGVLLAWTTTKPQFSWFFLLILAINAVRRRQFRLMSSFVVSLLVYWGLSWAILPGWPSGWIAQLETYARLNPVNPPLKDYLGFVLADAGSSAVLQPAAGVLLAGSAGLIWLWVRGKLEHYLLLNWAGAVTFLLNPSGRAYDQLPYLIAFLLSTSAAFPPHSTPSRQANLLFGLGLVALIVISWGLFALGKGPFPSAADRWLFPFYLVWLAGWGLSRLAFQRPNPV